MATKHCIPCLRTLQRQTRSLPRLRNTSRAFTTTTTRAIAAHPNRDAPSVSETPDSTPGAQSRSPRKGKKIFETYTVYGMTELIYNECKIQADYSIPQAKDEDAEIPKTEDGEDLGVGGGWWHTELGLKPTFSTWSQVTMLHMYLLSARFRNLPGDQSQPWQQHFLDHFFYDAEDRMAVNHNMHARGTRNKYLKDLFVQWRGLLVAYDEGISKGDAVLAAAVWRNVFKGDENVDITKLAQIVSYIRRLLRGLDGVEDDDLMTNVVGFGTPKDEENLVKLKSAQIDIPFNKATPKDLGGGSHGKEK